MERNFPTETSDHQTNSNEMMEKHLVEVLANGFDHLRAIHSIHISADDDATYNES